MIKCFGRILVSIIEINLKIRVVIMGLEGWPSGWSSCLISPRTRMQTDSPHKIVKMVWWATRPTFNLSPWEAKLGGARVLGNVTKGSLLCNCRQNLWTLGSGRNPYSVNKIESNSNSTLDSIPYMYTCMYMHMHTCIHTEEYTYTYTWKKF